MRVRENIQASGHLANVNAVPHGIQTQTASNILNEKLGTREDPRRQSLASWRYAVASSRWKLEGSHCKLEVRSWKVELGNSTIKTIAGTGTVRYMKKPSGRRLTDSDEKYEA